MTIRLLQLDLARIEAAEHDQMQVDGIVAIKNGLPPSFILEEAAAAMREGKDALWYGPFVFVETTLERIVGSGIFKGEPSDGWVEIGYGVASSCQGHGYATAAVLELVRFAFGQAGITAVYAETGVTNLASRRVVQKAGFLWTAERLSEDDGPVDCWVIEAPSTDAAVEPGARPYPASTSVRTPR